MKGNKLTNLKDILISGFIIRKNLIKSKPNIWKSSFRRQNKLYLTTLNELLKQFKIRRTTLFTYIDPNSLEAFEHQFKYSGGRFRSQNGHYYIELSKNSLVTFTHEFAHLLQEEFCRRNTEVMARKWSHTVFYIASPKMYRKAMKKGTLLHKRIPLLLNLNPEEMIRQFLTILRRDVFVQSFFSDDVLMDLFTGY